MHKTDLEIFKGSHPPRRRDEDDEIEGFPARYIADLLYLADSDIRAFTVYASLSEKKHEWYGECRKNLLRKHARYEGFERSKLTCWRQLPFYGVAYTDLPADYNPTGRAIHVVLERYSLAGRTFLVPWVEPESLPYFWDDHSVPEVKYHPRRVYSTQSVAAASIVLSRIFAWERLWFSPWPSETEERSLKIDRKWPPFMKPICDRYMEIGFRVKRACFCIGDYLKTGELRHLSTSMEHVLQTEQATRIAKFANASYLKGCDEKNLVEHDA